MRFFFLLLGSVFGFHSTLAQPAPQLQPSQLRVVSSDATSWTVEIFDPDGLEYAAFHYGRVPRTYEWFEFPENCPQIMRVRVLKERRFLWQTFPFVEAEIVDCSAHTGPAYVVTWVRINEEGRPRIIHTNERTFEEDAFLARVRQELYQRDLIRTAAWIAVLLVLFLHLFLMLMALWIWWRALGPFIRERRE